jgi:hypothetical protein
MHRRPEQRRGGWRRRLPRAAVFALVAVTGMAAAASSLDRDHAAHLPAPPLRVPGLGERTLELALRAHARARARGEIARPLLSIIDYALPSTEKRLWVIDLERRRVLFHELVAHGQGTGDNEARRFSNVPGSHRSSLGVFRTGAIYTGKHGVSLRLEGLEPGVNDRAAERAIVVHGASYVSDQFAARHGRIGRSHGCPAVREAIADSLIATIHGGTLLFAAYPDTAYASRSSYLAP